MALATTMDRCRSLGGALTLLACSAGGALAATTGDGKVCIPTTEPTTLDTGPASAGYISNITNSGGSIRAESHRMLTAALESARSKNPPSWIKFTATPALAKDPGDAAQACAHEEQTTRSKPLEFDEKHFDSVDDMTSWIMDFTRGKGDEGSSLYERCPGKCSPQYIWWIEPQGNGMAVKPSAVCGLPRDRDSNKYELKTAIAPPCAD